MTQSSDQQVSQLRQQIRRLEGQLSEQQQRAQHHVNEANRYLNVLSQTERDLKAIAESVRWKLGNRLIGVLERLLLRPKPVLVIDSLGQKLAALLSHSAPVWKLQTTTAPPISTGEGEILGPQLMLPVEFSASVFSRWIETATLGTADRVAINQAITTENQEIEQLTHSVRWPGDLPQVSIVMPTFNRASIISEAIESVLQQSYPSWELLICDDGSDDDTASVISQHADPRIRHLALPHRGAAAARNSGLSEAAGSITAYLDSDNIWHPHYLATMVSTLLADRSRDCAYCSYYDLQMRPKSVRLRSAQSSAFRYESLEEKNFIDLNSFVHWHYLFGLFGGFTETLPRQQDWDLILKYTYLRDPALADFRLALYRRNSAWSQLTELRKSTAEETGATIAANVQSYYDGKLLAAPVKRPRVTVLIWDICRNHFSKAFNIAEALSETCSVQLIGFRFFDEEIFPPYAQAEPSFDTHYIDGSAFPDFFSAMKQALALIDGEFIYCVKPRLPSLGLALLAYYHRGIPFAVESNDLESVVSNPDHDTLGSDQAGNLALDLASEALLTPYHDHWTRHLESLMAELPLKITHNVNLNRWLGGNCRFFRNLKDESAFDPDQYDRGAIRQRLGFEPQHRVILFSGLVRRHKGIFALESLLTDSPEHIRLLVVGSRTTPDLKKLSASNRLIIVEPQDRNAIAQITLVADGIVLWLDPNTEASHYQMPFKLTDALAMNVPVFANRVSDLAELIDQGYLHEVPFGNHALLLEKLLADPITHTRKLYLRQFSYAACRANFGLLLEQAKQFPPELAAAKTFAKTFEAFYQQRG